MGIGGGIRARVQGFRIKNSTHPRKGRECQPSRPNTLSRDRQTRELQQRPLPQLTLQHQKSRNHFIPTRQRPLQKPRANHEPRLQIQRFTQAHHVNRHQLQLPHHNIRFLHQRLPRRHPRRQSTTSRNRQQLPHNSLHHRDQQSHNPFRNQSKPASTSHQDRKPRQTIQSQHLRRALPTRQLQQHKLPIRRLQPSPAIQDHPGVTPQQYFPQSGW